MVTSNAISSLTTRPTVPQRSQGQYLAYTCLVWYSYMFSFLWDHAFKVKNFWPLVTSNSSVLISALRSWIKWPLLEYSKTWPIFPDKWHKWHYCTKRWAVLPWSYHLGRGATTLSPWRWYCSSMVLHTVCASNTLGWLKTCCHKRRPAYEGYVGCGHN